MGTFNPPHGLNTQDEIQTRCRVNFKKQGDHWIFTNLTLSVTFFSTPFIFYFHFLCIIHVTFSLFVILYALTCHQLSSCLKKKWNRFEILLKRHCKMLEESNDWHHFSHPLSSCQNYSKHVLRGDSKGVPCLDDFSNQSGWFFQHL